MFVEVNLENVHIWLNMDFFHFSIFFSIVRQKLWGQTVFVWLIIKFWICWKNIDADVWQWCSCPSGTCFSFAEEWKSEQNMSIDWTEIRHFTVHVLRLLRLLTNGAPGFQISSCFLFYSDFYDSIILYYF